MNAGVSMRGELGLGVAAGVVAIRWSCCWRHACIELSAIVVRGKETLEGYSAFQLTG